MGKQVRDFLSYWFIGMIYLFAVIRATLIPMHAPLDSWQMLLFALGVFLFYALVNTKSGRIVFLSSVVLFAAYLAFFLLRNGAGSLASFFAPVTRLMQVIVQVGTGYYDTSIPNSMLMCAIGLFSMIAGMPIYYFLVKYFKAYLLILLGLAFFMTVWGLNHHVDKPAFFIFIIVAIIVFIQHLFLQHNQRNRESGDVSPKGNILLYFIPVALLIILIATWFPASPLPIQWAWLDEKINTVYWDMHHKYAVDRYDKFSLASTGFGDPSRLGGPVRQDYTPIMTVHAPTRVYLRGAVYDRYTGIGWKETGQEKENFLMDRNMDHQELRFGWKATVDPLQMKYGNKELDHFTDLKDPAEYIQFLKLQQIPEELRLLHPEAKLTIRHLNVRTKTVFTPLKMFIPILGLSSDGIVLEENISGIVQADRRLKGQSQYEISYIQPGYGMTQLHEFFHSSRPGIVDEFVAYNMLFLDNLTEEDVLNLEIAKQEVMDVIDLYRQIQRHRDEVYELYTRLPENLPERVFTLARGITSDADTTYGKMKSLEQYLRQHFNYTLNPQYTPEDRDFVDYFLFDGRKGYCSYFASALCVMSRGIGIPARYVEGFLLPEKSDENGYYHVSNQHAHAWVEAYLEGVGWVTFEPTPPFAGAMNYYINLSSDQNAQGSPYGMDPEFDEEFYRRQYSGEYNINLEGIEGQGKSTKEILLFVLAAIFLLFLLNRLFVLGRGCLLYFMNPEKSVPILYHYIVLLLGQTKCHAKMGETPKDFAARVDERYHFVYMSMGEMVDIFYRVRFGERTLDRGGMKMLFRLVREIKIKSGRNMYIAKRILKRGLLFQG